MERLTENKIVLVVRRTRLDDLVARFNTEAQARFYVEHLGADFTDYQDEDRQYKASVAIAEQKLSQLGRLQVVDRAFVPNFIFGARDVVVVTGQDGLVANVLKYLSGQPVVGVNPDPARWEGVLLPFTVADLGKVLPEVFARKRPTRHVTMAQVTLNTGQTLYGVNDIFVGPRTHTSARYLMRIGSRTEFQSSSGIIVSTGMGSTGWLRSILTGATGITSSLTGRRLAAKNTGTFSWDANYLYFSVREPWPSRQSSASVTFGKIVPEEPLCVTSQMPEHGVIFSDGIESDYLQFNSGTQATISVAQKKGLLVV